jgi:hypothetical protein
VLAAGHGGQVLLSAATQELVRETLPAGASLRDLGAHPLKDLPRPEHSYQIVIPGQSADFPPLRTLGTRPQNLPRPATGFIGREPETAAVLALLRRADGAVVTLTGPGGTGKTRLAIHVAGELLEEFEHGAFFIDLAPLIDPTLAGPTMAPTLGLTARADLVPLDQLLGYLQDKPRLLVLDNFEHLLPAAGLVEALRRSAPGFQVLATHRQHLQLCSNLKYYRIYGAGHVGPGSIIPYWVRSSGDRSRASRPQT